MKNTHVELLETKPTILEVKILLDEATDLSALKTQELSLPEYEVTHLYRPASLQE